MVVLIIVVVLLMFEKQTGRKPSGLCGAALYMSVLAHGFRCSKLDIRLSSKVNYDRLWKLLDEPVALENLKKARLELPSDNHDNFEWKLEDKIKHDELGSADEIGDGDYENSLYEGNAYGTYVYEDY
ncbi:hypothetical protein VNO77_34657 [Canavalia gladiata]|uniref:Uncharacterized protein n=1 Tax=Canavalia gladiata TaxID=3824 RepID=A0AAN9KGH7_CANGL